MQRPGPNLRSYSVTPGWPITFEVHRADGGVSLVLGVIVGVPWPAGELAQRIVVRDAAASPLPADSLAAQARRRMLDAVDEPEPGWQSGDTIFSRSRR